MYQKSPDQLSGKGGNSGEIVEDPRPIFFAGGNTHTNVHPRGDPGRAAINISMKPKYDGRNEERSSRPNAILISRRNIPKGKRFGKENGSVMMK